MQYNAATVDQYLAALPPDGREIVAAVRALFLSILLNGCIERKTCGIIGYLALHSKFPPSYDSDPKQPDPFAGLASQLNRLPNYLGCVDDGQRATPLEQR